MGAIDSPDLFDVVEGPHFRTEQVDDDVTSIQQHPVTVRHTFDLHLAQAHFLEQAQKVVSQGTDVTVRTARSHDHGVGHRAFAAQVDQDKVLCLVEIQLRQNGVFQVGLAGRQRLVFTSVILKGLVTKLFRFRMEGIEGVRVTLCRLGSDVMRIVRGVGAQRRAPIGLPKDHYSTCRTKRHPSSVERLRAVRMALEERGFRGATI